MKELFSKIRVKITSCNAFQMVRKNFVSFPSVSQSPNPAGCRWLFLIFHNSPFLTANRNCHTLLNQRFNCEFFVLTQETPGLEEQYLAKCKNTFEKYQMKENIMVPMRGNSGDASGKILIQRRYRGLTSTLNVTVLEPTLKSHVQTACGKRNKDLSIKVSKVTESMEASGAVPQHLQRVPVVRFYQKLQSLLAVPGKWNQKKKIIGISILCSNLTGGFYFQCKYNIPFHSSQVSAWGIG